METTLIDTRIIQFSSSGKIDTYTNRDNTFLNILSYIDIKPRKIHLSKILNEGSYNTIYSIINSRNKIEKKLIMRLSKKKVTFSGIKMELKGVKINKKLCTKNKNIGKVIDYGRIITKNDTYHQEYSILEKYGVSLKFLLENNNTYKNINVPLRFIRLFLETLHCIHTSGYAHLDLKPSNILLKKIFKNKRIIDDLEFSVIDFGACRPFQTTESRFIKKQMASAAFSPPELMNRQFGKKNDIWAFGVICYLVIINKFFFKANGIKMFVNENKKLIEKNIKKELDKLRKNMIPSKIKSMGEIENYIQNMNSDFHIDVLKDFFLKIFTIDPMKRPTTSELLDHSLFKI